MKLTIKQENFCNYYLETGNASEAYRRSYSCDNMKDETVNVKAAELLNNGKITVRVRELQAVLQERSNITKDEAVKSLTNITRACITDILTAKGKCISVKDLKALPYEIRQCIKSIKSGKNGIAIEMYDRITAIDKLSKMLGWYTPYQVEANVVHSKFEGWSDEQLIEFIKGNIDTLEDE